MRVLAVTNLFPNAQQPNRGVFNRQQFEALSRHCDLRVVAPLPWQPWSHGLARPCPYREEWDGISTLHPLYFYTPWVGRAAYAMWLSLSLRPVLHRIAAEQRPDVLLATWAYPDVVATAWVARRARLPFVARVHGSDINVLTEATAVRAQIRWALRRAACVFAVSHPMRQRLVDLGIPEERIRVQYNGVDVRRFHPIERSEARARLGLPEGRRLVLYVGNLESIKGALDLVEAAGVLAGGADPPHFVLVGRGRLQGEIEARVRQGRLADCVILAGAKPHAQIPDWIGAADALCLPSHHEGCPNVVLEALACGRPVIATAVGAVPDLVDPGVGIVAPPGQPARLAEAIRTVLSRDWDPERIRQRVLPLSWEENAMNLASELRRAARGERREAAELASV
jgi:glycosyltransferase involved in cell wall biosynthesis